MRAAIRAAQSESVQQSNREQGLAASINQKDQKMNTRKKSLKWQKPSLGKFAWRWVFGLAHVPFSSAYPKSWRQPAQQGIANVCFGAPKIQSVGLLWVEPSHDTNSCIVNVNILVCRLRWSTYYLHHVFILSVSLSVGRFVSRTTLKLLDQLY